MVAKGQRYLKIVGGFSLVGVGLPMLFLPGPGAPAIILGLGLLAAEYVWARRLLDGVKRQTARVSSAVKSRIAA